MKAYEHLRNKYPQYVSLDQFYRICKISKKSARYLVENGIVPATDTGNKTWRYQIAIDDVITYLRTREKVGSMIPPGAVSNRPQNKSRNIGNRKSYSQIVASNQKATISEYFDYIYSNYDDVLMTEDIVEMTGLNKSTVLKLLQDGHIQSLQRRPKYIVPKKYLLAFLGTQKFLEMRTASPQFIKILGGFEIWKTAKSSQ